MSSQPQVQSERITIGDAELYVEMAGSGPDLVLVHSGITDRRMWDDQFLAFAEQFRTVHYDLRGFGESSAITGPYSHVDDLRGLIDHLGLERPRAVAASLGGRVTIDLAVTEPELFERLVLVGPAISGMRFEDPLLRSCWEEMGAAWDAGDIERVIALETEIWVNGPGRPAGSSHPEAFTRVVEMQRRIYERAPEDDPEEEIDPPAIERLDTLALPVLIIVGEHDVSDIRRNGELIRDKAPSADLLILPNTGHLPNLEEPEAFNTMVLAFMQA